MQEIVTVSRESLLKIASMNWCSQEAFEKAVGEEALSSKIVVVPKLMPCDKVECLRIKIVDKKERSTLCQWTHNMPTRFEKVKSRSLRMSHMIWNMTILLGFLFCIGQEIQR